jgi:hypothetical protein
VAVGRSNPYSEAHGRAVAQFGCFDMTVQLPCCSRYGAGIDDARPLRFTSTFLCSALLGSVGVRFSLHNGCGGGQPFADEQR